VTGVRGQAQGPRREWRQVIRLSVQPRRLDLGDGQGARDVAVRAAQRMIQRFSEDGPMVRIAAPGQQPDEQRACQQGHHARVSR